MPKRKPPTAAVRAYLRELGAKGGKAAAGRGGKKQWASVPPEERSKRMRALIEKRWAKERTKQKRSR